MRWLRLAMNTRRIQFLFTNKVDYILSNSSIPLFSQIRKMDTGITPIRKEFKFNHYRQQHEWDCGLSCILMLLPNDDREYFIRNFDQICYEEGFGTSTWTIDLCYLLKRFHINHVYFTKTIGVDPTYLGHNYYKNIIRKDEERVNKRFRNAESNGILVDKRKLTFNEILKHLSNNGPVILLTDSTLLNCDICKVRKDIDVQHYYASDEATRYVGHYVLLVGYDTWNYKIFYRNPASENHVCISSMALMDKARIAFGTDEDIILIYL